MNEAHFWPGNKGTENDTSKPHSLPPCRGSPIKGNTGEMAPQGLVI
jgi:hypothetical protein